MKLALVPNYNAELPKVSVPKSNESVVKVFPLELSSGLDVDEFDEDHGKIVVYRARRISRSKVIVDGKFTKDFCLLK